MRLCAVLMLLPVVTGYCTAGKTVMGDSNLGAVYLLGHAGTRIEDLSNCPGQLGMIDLTNLSATVYPGNKYHLRFDVTTCDQGWARLAYAYLDFNNNDVYDNNELLGQFNVDNRVTPVPLDFEFQVPCIETGGSKPGRTRMRVFVVESGFVPNPCLTFAYGGVKEFSIDIPNAQCSVTIAPTPPPTAAGYCGGGPTELEDSNLGPVQLVGELRTLINDNTNCPNFRGIRDLTTLSASLMAGGTYELEFEATTCKAAYTRDTWAYIDFNGNKQFEFSELIGHQSVPASLDPQTVNYRFTVPCLDKGAFSGVTRMRVFVTEGPSQSPDPCYSFPYGGVKDFSVQILREQERACLPPVFYCKAGPTTVGDSNLGAVYLYGVQDTSIVDPSNCPGKKGIQNLTALSVQVQPGGDFQLEFEATTCNLGWARLAYAYVDWNFNSQFERSELLGVQNVPATTTPVEVRFPFVVPCIGNGTLVGTTRLRVYVVEAGIDPDPCLVFTEGGVKDFSIEILNKPGKLCTVPPPPPKVTVTIA